MSKGISDFKAGGCRYRRHRLPTPLLFEWYWIQILVVALDTLMLELAPLSLGLVVDFFGFCHSICKKYGGWLFFLVSVFHGAMMLFVVVVRHVYPLL
jgi:hypothetical protein